MKISLFCILKADLLFVPPPFVPHSEPRALSAGCLPGREGGAASGQAPGSLNILWGGERWGSGGIKGGVNEGGEMKRREGGYWAVMGQ